MKFPAISLSVLPVYLSSTSAQKGAFDCIVKSRAEEPVWRGTIGADGSATLHIQDITGRPQ